MRIKKQSEILDLQTRKILIEEIEASENKARKREAFRRYQCYKDMTNRYVAQMLLDQFDVSTVIEMRYAIANISIVKKVIDKLAKVYSSGADRTISDDQKATQTIEKLEKYLCINTEMKKTNRFLKLQKNLALYVKPCPVGDKWTIKLEPLNPYLYDVVEDYYDRTKPLVYILSSYTPPADSFALLDPAYRTGTPTVAPQGNNRDEKIADTPSDQTKGEDKQYVFWSDDYHFTTNSQGEFIPNPENTKNENPFGICPITNFAIDQDGAFWALGGQDLVDGAILVNAMISNNNHIGVVQGYGQFYMTGENLPKTIKVGPSKAIIAEYKLNEQAEPKMGFLSANPQLDSLKGLYESYIALLLTTNNLSTSGIATQLSGGPTMPSGIALVIDKSESIEDIQDQRQLFVDKEPETFERINAILTTYKGKLVPELEGLSLPENFEDNFNIKFMDSQAIMTEAEKLGNLKLRKDLGIDSMLGLLKRDDPTLTDEQAEDKLKKILADRIKEKLFETDAQEELGTDQTAAPEEDPPVPPQDPNAVPPKKKTLVPLNPEDVNPDESKKGYDGQEGNVSDN